MQNLIKPYAIKNKSNRTKRKKSQSKKYETKMIEKVGKLPNKI